MSLYTTDLQVKCNPSAFVMETDQFYLKYMIQMIGPLALESATPCLNLSSKIH